MYNNYGNYGLTNNPEINTDFLVGGGAASIIIFSILFLIIIAIAVIVIIAQCKLFTKAGEKWWKALIPGYSLWVETRIAGLAWWWYPICLGLAALLSNYPNNYVIYIVLLLVTYNYMFNLAKKFGKSTGFAVFLSILPVIALPILGFGSAKYDKAAKVDKNGIYSIEK